MTQRDVFPRAGDRAEIVAFLMGGAKHGAKRNAKRDTDTLTIFARGPVLAFVYDTTAIAWYDTAGALVASIGDGIRRATAMLAVNAIMAELGQPAMQVTRERDEDHADPHAPTPIRYFFDGAPVTPGTPFVLTGPIGVLAYRASRT